jgi:hypothetical protein
MKAFTTAFALLASASSALGALQQVTGFGSNPSNIQMYISVPAKVATNPAVIVAVSLQSVLEYTGYLLILLFSSTPVAVQPSNGTAVPSCQLLQKAWASY